MSDERENVERGTGNSIPKRKSSREKLGRNSGNESTNERHDGLEAVLSKDVQSVETKDMSEEVTDVVGTRSSRAKSKSRGKNKTQKKSTLLHHAGFLVLDVIFAAVLIVVIIGVLFFSGEQSEFIYMRF